MTTGTAFQISTKKKIDSFEDMREHVDKLRIFANQHGCNFDIGEKIVMFWGNLLARGNATNSKITRLRELEQLFQVPEEDVNLAGIRLAIASAQIDGKQYRSAKETLRPYLLYTNPGINLIAKQLFFLASAYNGDARAPDFRAHIVDGYDKDNEFHLCDSSEDYTLLLFWQTWCPTCLSEMTEIKDLQSDLGRKLRIVGITNVNMETDIEQITSTRKRLGADFTQIMDTGDITRRYSVNHYPLSVLVDKKCLVRYYGTGERLNEIERIVRDELGTEK